ncbi:MAG: SDR family NAD(P)-dependent oxidoreductase [Proteobacteria bacterium]|nr:MAG: SDR family NAD(P)-dependent oxidoreductase [Pseudomonadota bacterium]
MEKAKRKFAVVTGASTGIGYELTKQFVKHGYDVLAIADEERIFSAARELSELGGSVRGLQVDLAQPKGVHTVVQAIEAEGKPLNAIAFNAGVAVSGDFVRDNALEDELNLIALNITSVVHLAKHVLPAMVERGEGKVLITSSIAALMPGPFYATYAASKSFLLSFSEGLTNELKDTGVTVTALMPGPTETEFFHRAGMEDTKAGVSEKDDPAQVAEQGFRAMLAGEDHCIGGSFKNKVQGFATRFLSEQQRATIHRSLTEPGSAAKQ